MNHDLGIDVSVKVRFDFYNIIFFIYFYFYFKNNPTIPNMTKCGVLLVFHIEW